jgi:hypothetical protein
MSRTPIVLAKDQSRVSHTATAAPRPEDARARAMSVAQERISEVRLPVPDPRQVYDLRRIAARYDLSSMSGTDAVRLASDLVACGFEEADALALTLPISSRNLMSKMGKVARAPRIESWTDLMLHHVQQLHGVRGVDRKRLDQLARMVALSEVLAEAEQEE